MNCLQQQAGRAGSSSRYFGSTTSTPSSASSASAKNDAKAASPAAGEDERFKLSHETGRKLRNGDAANGTGHAAPTNGHVRAAVTPPAGRGSSSSGTSGEEHQTRATAASAPGRNGSASVSETPTAASSSGDHIASTPSTNGGKPKRKASNGSRPTPSGAVMYAYSSDRRQQARKDLRKYLSPDEVMLTFAGLREKATPACVSAWAATKRYAAVVGNGALTLARNPAVVKVWWAKTKHAVHHFVEWNKQGFGLFWVNLKLAKRLIRRRLKGEVLTYRDRKLLVRTIADMGKLIPFSVFIIVPFAEVFLPPVLYFFPNLMPSTFLEKGEESENMKKTLKVKKELAVIRFSRLFGKWFTFDNLPEQKLRIMADILGLEESSLFRSTLALRLRHHINRLRFEDREVLFEGVDTLRRDDLVDLCRARAIPFTNDVSVDEMRASLNSWLELSSHRAIPASVLLWIQTYYLSGKGRLEELEVAEERKEKSEKAALNKKTLDDRPIAEVLSMATELPPEMTLAVNSAAGTSSTPAEAGAEKEKLSPDEEEKLAARAAEMAERLQRTKELEDECRRIDEENTRRREEILEPDYDAETLKDHDAADFEDSAETGTGTKAHAGDVLDDRDFQEPLQRSARAGAGTESSRPRRDVNGALLDIEDTRQDLVERVERQTSEMQHLRRIIDRQADLINSQLNALTVLREASADVNRRTGTAPRAVSKTKSKKAAAAPGGGADGGEEAAEDGDVTDRTEKLERLLLDQRLRIHEAVAQFSGGLKNVESEYLKWEKKRSVRYNRGSEGEDNRGSGGGADDGIEMDAGHSGNNAQALADGTKSSAK
eukprot:g5109.t1